MSFNASQTRAIHHKNGPMLVLAGPGSGKTLVITERTKYLIEECGIDPAQILVITFTKAAATEMKRRFQRKMNRLCPVTFGTFHAVFFTILKAAYNYSARCIITPQVQHEFVKDQIHRLELEYDDEKEAVDGVLSEISRVKGEAVNIDEYESRCIPPQSFRIIYMAYDDMLVRKHLIDFDDMIVQCRELLMQREDYRRAWQNKYKYILIDEFQDINKAQFDVVRILADEYRNLFVVGDDDQSIYAFRGARPDFLLHFPTLYPAAKKVTLNKNYRSTERIVNLAERVIGNNEVRFVKNMKGIGEAGDKVTFFLAEDAAKEAAHIAEKIGRLLDEGVPLTEIAVIYRTNLQGGAFARELYKRGIPYDLRDNSGNVYEHWVAKDLLAYLLLAENEESDSALRRILNKPKRYIGKDLLAEAETMPYTLLRSFFVCPSLKGWQEENLENLRIDLNQIRKRTSYDAVKYIRKVIGYDEYLEEFAAYRRTSAQVLQEIADEIMETAKDCADVRSFREQLERLSLQMKEQSRKKGQKRNGVALMTMHGAKGLEFRAVFLPSLVEGIVPHEKGMDTVAEERRLFYVAMTRASEKLCLSAILQRYEKERKPSRFLAEMGLDAETAFRKNKEKEGNKR